MNEPIDESSQLSEVIDRFVEDHISELYTALPCKVEKIDTDKNTVDVKIKTKEFLGVGGAEEIDTLKEVPILDLGTKKVIITMPIKEGDEGLVIFSSRSIDDWENGHKEMRDNRTLDISDGMFIPLWLRASKDKIKKRNKEDLEFRAKCVDDLRFQIKPKEKAIWVGFKKDKQQIKAKLDEMEFMVNDEKDKVKIKKGKITVELDKKINIETTKDYIKLSIGGDLKIEIKKDRIVFHEKAEFKERVEFKQGFKSTGLIEMDGVVKINGVVQKGS